MADAPEEVKDVEVVEVEPTKDDETVETPDSSQEKKEELVKPAPEKPEVKDDLHEVDGETPRERALRLELTRLKRQGRQERTQEIFEKAQPVVEQKKEIPADVAKVLGKYKPEELQSLREVLPLIADEIGFVRKDQLGATTYADKAQEELDTFLEKHPEYLPEKDSDGTLWNAFKTEYQLYKQPANPKDFKKIFERIHKDVFGIQVGTSPKLNAAQEKVKSASHAGTPGPASKSSQQAKPTGVRLDMLKGFTEKELAEMGGE